MSEQSGRGRGVAPIGGAQPRCAEMLERGTGEPLGVLVVQAELDPHAMGLLKVVPDELVELGRALAQDALEVLGECFMEGRSLGLRDCVVCGVSKQDVAEPERVAAAEVGRARPDDILEQEPSQLFVEARAALLRNQSRHR